MKIKHISLILIMLLMQSCFLDRSGTGGEPATWSVQPDYFCPSDEVTVAWNFNDLPTDRENCDFPNGGYSSPQSCDFDSMCSAGNCLDGYCCSNTITFAECGSPIKGCLPDTEINISSETETLDPVVESDNNISGSRTLTPSDTVSFTLSGAYTAPLRLFRTESRQATIVRPDPATNATLNFPFVCSSAGPSWAFHDVDTNGPTSSENVRIIGIRNTSSRTINLTGGDPARGPVTIRSGEVVTDFNGLIAGTWVASIPPIDRVGLPTPRCEPTNIANPYPNLQVELILDCVVDEP